MQVCPIDLYMQGSEGRVVNQSPDSAFPSVAAEQSRRLHLHSEARAPFQRLSSSSTQWRTARRWERMTTRATKPLIRKWRTTWTRTGRLKHRGCIITPSRSLRRLLRISWVNQA